MVNPRIELPRVIAAVTTANMTAPAGQHLPVDATAGTVTIALPAAIVGNVGAHLSIEKTDSTANTVSITGSLRGATGTLTLTTSHETIEFRADAAGSWWPQANHLPKSYVTSAVAVETARAQAAEQAIQAALLTELPEWQPNTAYTAGWLVVNPSGQIVQAPTGFTSGALYNAANWTILSLTVATVTSLIAAQAAADSATYVPLWKANTAYASGQAVVNPSGQLVTANTGFTSGATYSSSNWTVTAGGGSSSSAAGYDIVILAGQSNMSGRGTPYSTALDPVNAAIFQYGNTGVGANTITAASEPLLMHDTPTGIGPGLQFARWYVARKLATGRRVLLVPVAHGGTPLSSTATLAWRRGGATGNLYANMISQAQAALTAANTAYPAGANKIVAALWIQGETDGDNANTGLQYETDFDALINGLRTDLSLPALPFIIGTMVPEYLTSGTRNQINAVHRATPNRITGVDVAVGATAMNMGDGNHYNAPGQRANGLTMYSAFERITQGIAPYSETLDVPARVTGLTVGAITGSSVALSWAAANQATSYQVQYRLTGGSTWTTFATISGTTSTVTGLAGSTAYDFSIVGVNSLMVGTPSAIANATTSAGTPAVTNTVAPAVTPTSSVGNGTVLTTTNGTWSVTPDSYTYQWNRAGTAISAATSSTYTVTAGDLAQALTCTVTAVKFGYTSGVATSNTVTASSGVYVSDFFNRADSTTSIGTADSGQTYTLVGGSVWGIKSNRAYEVSGANGQAYIDAGVSDCTVAAIFAVLAGGTQMRLIFRGDGTNSNYWMLQFRQATSKYQLYKTVAGVATQIGTDLAVTPAAGDSIAIVLSGSSITVKVNGTTAASTTDTALQTNTKHGLGMANFETSAAFDNFIVST